MKQDEFDNVRTLPKKLEIIESNKIKKVLLKGKLYMSWKKGDEISERMAIVQLYEIGIETKEELAKVFQMHINTIKKYVRGFKTKGGSSLISESRGPKERWKLVPDIRAKILVIVLKEGIKEYASIQRRFKECWKKKVSIESIRQVLITAGLVKERIEYPVVEQGELFDEPDDKRNQLQISLCFPSEKDAESKTDSKDKEEDTGKSSTPERRKVRSDYSSSQRIYLDQLEHGIYSAYAGGLLFAPLLDQYKFLPTIKRVIDIETHEGYSLDDLCMTLFYYDLFRFESIENFKTVYPEEFGIVIGRLSSPSIFTLRRFLHNVRELEKSEELIDEFAKEYLRKGLAKWGVLYIDGHFLPYYGMYHISKGWHSVRKRAMRGSYNFLAVDERFSPVLFLIRSSSEDLLQKIPEIILKAKESAREVDIDTNNLIVLFDREGYSAELFRMLDGKEDENRKFKVRFITWAKYSDRWVNDIEDEKFAKSVIVTYEIQDDGEIKYYDTKKTMSKYGKIRAIVIESGGDKKRIAIYTNADEEEIGSERIIQLICRRWGEENLIKELMRKHVIDYSPGYEWSEMKNQPEVDNPKVEKLKQKKIKQLSELSHLKSKFGHEVLEEMAKDAKWEDIKKKQLLTIGDIEIIRSQITLLDIKIGKLAGKVSFDEAYGKKLVHLNYEKKRFLDCIKVFTYNMEKKMCEILSNYYDKKKEIWPAVAMIVRRGGYVKLEHGKLTVRLRRFKNPEIDYAARHLCEDLNQRKPFTLDKFCLPVYYKVQ